MSLWTTIESFFTSAEAEIQTIEAGFVTADNFVGTVLGDIETAGTVITAFDPALGAEVEAGAAAVSALRATIKAGLAAGGSAVSGLAADVTSLFMKAAALRVQVAPFINDAAKEVSAIDAAAVAAAKTAAASVPAATA